jgi:hypothetical protein
MLLAVLIVAKNDELILRSGLLELSYFLVGLPSAFVNLTSLLELVSSLSVLLVIFETSLISVSVAVYDLCVSFKFIVHEITLNDLVESLDVELTLSFTFSVDELTDIDVSVTVFESTLTPEVILSELTSVLFVIKSIDTLTMFLTIDKLTLIDTAVSFVRNTMSVLFAVSELAFIFDIFVQITEMSFAIELIIFELPFVLHDTLQSVSSIAVFFSLFVEIALIVSAVTLVDCSVSHSIFIELASKPFTIIKDKLRMGSHFDTISHLTLVD